MGTRLLDRAPIQVRNGIRLAALAMLVALLGADCARARPNVPSVRSVPSHLGLELVADAVFPSGSRFRALGPLPLGGLSGIAQDSDGRFLAVSDERAAPRVDMLSVAIARGQLRVTPLRRILLAVPPGLDVVTGSDFEAIVLSPNGHLLLSSEGESVREPRIPPSITEYDRRGRLIGHLDIPDKFVPNLTGPLVKGARDNEAFESLTLTPDGSRLITATERPLVQDSPLDGDGDTGLTRILIFSRENDRFKPSAEYLYPIDYSAKPADFGVVRGTNGLVELLAINSTELLALERSFVTELGSEALRSANVIRLYHVSLDGADDAEAFESVRDMSPVKTVQKTLVLDLTTLATQLKPELRALENFEGMCWGPRLPDGSDTLLLVSDDNFNARQVNAFVLLRMVDR